MTSMPVRHDGRAAPALESETQGKVPILVFGAWAALLLNVLPFLDLPVLVPIPGTVGRILTQGALPLALVLALAANRVGILRRSVFLGLLSVLALATLMASLHNEFPVGSVYRSLRLIGFISVLWLLTPWWGRSDMLLLRCHLRCVWLILVTVLAGAVLDPGDAFALNGRLGGALWPIPPTQVGHYAAVATGSAMVLWLCRVIPGTWALAGIAVGGSLLALTHTRTAVLAMFVGVLIAGVSLFFGHVRVRRTSALGAALAVLVVSVFTRELSSWAVRGQDTEDIGQLTGRTKVWSAVFAEPRSAIERVFGSGLTDQSFGGLPIDSDWVSAYVDQGWLGVALHGSLLLVLLVMAAVHERGPQRAMALFLVVYEMVASVTETTIVSPSPYLLELALAASLLAQLPSRRPG